MLRITIDLLPNGSENDAEKLGVIEIWNDGTGTEEIGNYRYRICKKMKQPIWIYNTVQGHIRDDSAWHLLFLCLKNVMYNERPVT